MRGIKIPQQDFALKMRGGGGGGAYARGEAYLRDTTVHTWFAKKCGMPKPHNCQQVAGDISLAS